MANLTFTDFCAGIGGGRLGVVANGLTCVGHSEIDPKPAKTYQLLFNEADNWGDLTKIIPANLPDFDLLLAGFPCQAFSINGKRQGFEDSRGQIIYYLAEILKTKKPMGFILENVKGLINHHQGKTLKSVVELLESLDYEVSYQVLDSINYGVPQMRERVYFVGIRKDIPHQPYQFPKPQATTDLASFLHPEEKHQFDPNSTTFQRYLNNQYNQGKFDLNEILKQENLVLDWRQSDLRLYKNKVPTLRTGRHGILYVKHGKLWKLSGYEALLLQGFPKSYAEKAKVIPNTQLLSQAGNAMTVTVIDQICQQFLKAIGR